MPDPDRLVLIVEDDDDLRESLREVFMDNGFEVVTAENGREAMACLRGRPPCVVILDLLMPVMSGGEVYEAMQADPALADIPVIICTGNATRAPSGAVVLKKPIDLDRLLDLVDTLC